MRILPNGHRTGDSITDPSFLLPRGERRSAPRSVKKEEIRIATPYEDAGWIKIYQVARLMVSG
jgi:hypothetical protein